VLVSMPGMFMFNWCVLEPVRVSGWVGIERMGHDERATMADKTRACLRQLTRGFGSHFQHLPVGVGPAT
jgi:hypothetical protein